MNFMNITSFVLINYLEKDHSMIKTCRFFPKQLHYKWSFRSPGVSISVRLGYKSLS